MKGRLGRALDALLGRTPAAPRLVRGLSGGVENRLQAWGSGLQSADQEIAATAPRARAHARDLEKNNPFVRAYLDNLADQVAGPTGFLMRSRIKAGTVPDAAANRLVEQAFRRWGRKGSPTVCGGHSWASLGRLIVRTVARDGEIFFRKVRDRRQADGFALQLIDADLVDASYNVRGAEGRNDVVQGIELDLYGRPVAYFVTTYGSDGYTSSAGSRRVRVPASEIVHIFEKLRPGQTRGMTWLHPVLVLLGMLGGYWDAEVAAARAEAERLGFLYSETGDAVPLAPPADTPGADASSPFTIESSTATFQGLPAGWKVDLPDVKHPTTAFGGFSRYLLQGIAAGLRTSYASISGDLTAVNFSSIRHGAMEERAVFRRMQRFFIEELAEPVGRAWAESAWMVGSLRSLTADQFEQALEPSWTGRGWDYVDPLKDAKADAMALDAVLTTRTRILAEQGEDFEDVLDEWKTEQDLARAKGVTFGPIQEPSIPLGDVNDDADPASANSAA